MDLADHLPGGGEDPFATDGLPELQVERPIVRSSSAEDAAPGHATLVHTP
jgi:hypothetical protein